MKTKMTVATALLALALVTFSIAAFAQGGKGQRGGGQHGKVFQQLTDEQKTQLQTKLDELKAAGAKPEEVRAAVKDMLKGWGIEMPQGQAGRGGGMRAVMEKLTPEQRTELQAKMKEMRQANKTPEEIRATMQEMLKGWGIEMPQAQGTEGRQNRGQGQGWMGQLTEEQRTQLKAKTDELKAAGAKPAEIRAAIAELCKGWGIEPPKAGGQRGGGIMKDLTPEQRQQVKAKVQEMKAAGAKPEEIRAAIQEILKAQPAPAQ